MVGSEKHKRVLVVDDNVDSAEMTVALLETWGHEAFHASDGDIALSMAREKAPDLVLLDIGLPGKDGHEVARMLRAEPSLKDLRIIALSGYSGEADRAKSLAAGCNEHLVKPIDVPTLERALRD